MASCREFTFPSSDGVHQVHAMEWFPESGSPRGVVQLVHGISEYIGRYSPFARFLTDHGFAVVGHDHLGHGKTASGREEYGYFADQDGWRHIRNDIRSLRTAAGERFPGLPYFLLGHSMGSFCRPTLPHRLSRHRGRLPPFRHRTGTGAPGGGGPAAVRLLRPA